jgi:hypothetical protein
MSANTNRTLDATHVALSVMAPLPIAAGVPRADAIRRAVLVHYAQEFAIGDADATVFTAVFPQTGTLAPLLRASRIEGTDEPAEAARFAYDLIRQVSALVVEQRTEDALDLVYDRVDELLLTRRFVDVDVLLRAAAQNALPLNVLVGFLTITLPWRAQLLDARLELANTIRAAAIRKGGEEKASALLRGLI